MKQFSIPMLMIITLSIISCKNGNTGKFSIDIQVPPGEYDSIACYLSQDKIAAYPLWMSNWENFDSTGRIHLEVYRDEITWAFIAFYPLRVNDNDYGTRGRVFLLAQPGKSYMIEYDRKHPMLFRISGDDEQAQNSYNLFGHSKMNNYPGDNWLTNTDSISTELLKNLNDSIYQTALPFAKLFDEGKIDEEYYETALTQIEYAHVKAFIHQLRIRQWAYKNPDKRKPPGLIPLNITDPELIRIMDKVFIQYPVSDSSARMAPSLNLNIDNFLRYKSWTDNEVTPLTDSVVIWPNNSFSEKMKRVDYASKYLDEGLIEQYFAHQFSSSPLKSGPDSLATFLYLEFKKRYPESPYLPGIMRSVNNLTNHYTAFYPGLEDSKNKDSSTGLNASYFLSPDVRFIEEQDTISSLASLLSHFRGNNLYIDFWASWCPPCRYEFRFKDSVQSYLEDLDIEMLYISTDTEEDKWLNSIMNYDLKGYHYRISNPELKKEINRLLHFIPTYWIVDSTGKVIDYEAERPHTKSKLYDQLANSFK